MDRIPSVQPMPENDFTAELARCDREIKGIRTQPNIEAVPAWWVALGVLDWEYEKRLIMKEQSAQSEPDSLADPQSVKSGRCDCCGSIPVGRRKRCRFCKRLLCPVCVYISAPDHGGPECRECYEGKKDA